MGTNALFSSVLMLLLVSIHKKNICFAARDRINTTQFLKDGETIVSPGGFFELGFFSPNNSLNRYVGIWFKQIPIRTYVWVANRDTPITNTSSSVVLKIINPGGLALVDDTNNNSILWHTNTSKSVQNPVAKLLDSGNLVISDANGENFLWQSFDHPTDTLLAGMIMGKNYITGLETSLSSWKAENNPGSGEYKVSIESAGYPQMVLRNGEKELYRSGPWNGLRWSGSPGQGSNDITGQTFVVVNTTGVFATFKVYRNTTFVRIVVSSSGNLIIYIWAEERGEWNPLRSAPSDLCDRYGHCGPYGSCDYSEDPICECLDDRFVHKDPVQWQKAEFSGGCVRRMPLNCQNGSSSSDVFVQYSGIKLPDSKIARFNKSMNLEECKRVCLKNCSCTAYSSLNITDADNGCLLWFGDLMDIRVLPVRGQDLFIRMASSESDHTSSSKGKKSKILKISLSLLFVLMGLSLAIILIFYKRERKKMEHKLKLEYDQTLFETATITRATDNFSLQNKIGEGGYGHVYKGVLDDGKEIAVKRLSKTSKQGFEECKNEVNFIAKLQHRNLVKLLGWCMQGDEKMLIYEYMPNKSLDSFIFDHTRRSLLDWSKRFDIINGIARGLLYLHHDSRLKIIHRDLKASNILLDDDMNPKISDFGLAKTFAGNEIGSNTSRVAGTQGYMSPEYAGYGIFSTKLDVFSFGVLILEIVSGKRNKGSSNGYLYDNLTSQAWKLHKDGRSIELVDEQLVESCNLTQISRTIHIGLLCVQHSPEDRPDISSIVQMLTNDVELPIAKEPGFFVGKELEGLNSTNTESTSSVNDASFSSFSPR